MTKTEHKFYTATLHMPGCLPDLCEPPPVFKDYGEAAEYLAYELDSMAGTQFDSERSGDTFDRMAAACRESTEDDVFAMDGPDGYRYAVEETESRGRWTTGGERTDPADPLVGYAVLTYTERTDGLGPTAKEAADDVSSLCGSMIEQPQEDNFAYVMIDSGRLAEAANELREAGFELVGADGELVEGD
jgi:hypothetical protein